ncbi:SDR family oxidoreductase, partial [Streptomyces sp. GSL17-113]
MSTPGTTLVIGATGTTGSRLASQLAAGGHRVRPAARRATAVAGTRAVRFDWNDPATFAEALDGTDRMYLVPPPGSPEP